MSLFSLSKNKIFIIGLLLVIIGGIFYLTMQRRTESTNKPPQLPNNTSQPSQNDKPQIVSTKPDPLDNSIVSGTDVIEITFNRPLQNVGEFKNKIEPKIEYKVELSADRKTARIIPAKPYPVGAGFTLSIGPDTKFDGMGEWRESKDFHFRTIKYTGV